MKRLHFLKNLFTITATAVVAPTLLASEKANEVYRFDEIFSVWPKNERLIYPKKDSVFYNQILESITGNVLDKFPTFLPVIQLQIPIKDSYTAEELKPIQYYFESVYCKKQNFAKMHDVIFRMIKVSEDRMHLEAFLNYKY